MLQPKRQKFRKRHKGRIHGKATRGFLLDKGLIGLKAEDPGYITERQIEAARRAIMNYLKRSGQVFIRIFPHIPVTKKPIETRMGKGKGAPDHFQAMVKKGTIIFEIANDNVLLAKEALRRAGAKLPIRIRIESVDAYLLETVESGKKGS